MSATNSTSPNSPPPPPPPIPIDRQWIHKLLQKHPNPTSRRMDKALVVAPMVDQSDLPFRMLCRRYGSNLAFTPMIHSRLLTEQARYRSKFLMSKSISPQQEQQPNDRPLIAQLCGSDPETVLQAAQLLEPHVDGIDINCGCPQGIARRGNYGAFLLEQEETLLTLVRHLVQHLHVPLCVKVRLLPAKNDKTSQQRSLELYTKLVDAGVHLLTIHGRTRLQKQDLVGQADWDTIREAVKLLGHRIPIFANGSIEDYSQVDACLEYTQADGVMSSESLLEYPPIFDKNHPQKKGPTTQRKIGRLQLAREYIQLAKEYPPDQGGQGSGLKCIRIHVHRFLHADLQADPTIRNQLVQAGSVEELEAAIDNVEAYHKKHGMKVEEEELSWYLRHRIDPDEEEEEEEKKEAVGDRGEEEEEDPDGGGVCLFAVDDGDY